MFKEFCINVVFANRWKYLVVVAVCILYASGLPLTGPRWYKAEAVMAIKNVQDVEFFENQRMANIPVPILLDEIPIAPQYDFDAILYTYRFAKNVVGNHFDELYDPSEYDGVKDFYDRFLMHLGFDYNGDLNTLTISFTYKDPELAAEFCNGFARNLEQYMYEVVRSSTIAPLFSARLSDALDEASSAEAEVHRIAEEHNIPDLLEAPKEWIKNYTEARRRSAESQILLEATVSALRQLHSERTRRNLLDEPGNPPDTNIIQDAILAVARLRLSMLNAALEISGETLPGDSPQREQIQSQVNYLNEYIAENYRIGLDIEINELLNTFRKYYIQNYLTTLKEEDSYSRIMALPELEAQIRPAIRRNNIAQSTVQMLNRLVNYASIGEQFENVPVMLIDPADPPLAPLQPAWNTLKNLIPTALFLSTLWFAFLIRINRESNGFILENSMNSAEEG